MKTSIRATCVLAVLLVGAAAPNATFQPYVKRYDDLVGNICRTGVTDDIVRAYEDARVAVDRAQYGGGRENNFWGLKTPGRFYQDCFQSPGNIR